MNKAAESLVSVVMPCYNAADTLARAIGSIQAQTRSAWELVVVDDGSTDHTGNVAREAAARDPRIRVLATPHGGIVAALVRGCEAAQGGFIARMDADDVAHPDRLRRQLELFDADPDLALCGTRVTVTGARVGPGRRRYEAWVNSLVCHEDIIRELFVECPLPHPTFVMRREAFEACGGYQDHGWPEDYDLCMRAFAAGLRFGKTPERLLEWAERPDRLSMTDPRYSPARFRALKRHYLFQTYLRGQGPFYQWGAGEVGKQWLREWASRGPVAAVDINPRKIGRTIHGIPVIAPEDLPPPGTSFVVVAVGAPRAREEIRAWLEPRGYRELQDFLFLA